MTNPTPSAHNGRDDRGRFTAGNRAAKGNPFAKRVGQLRSTMIQAVTADDLAAVVAKLVEAAKGGDTAAAKVLLDRVFGPPVAADILERIEALEGGVSPDPQLTDWHSENRWGAGK